MNMLKINIGSNRKEVKGYKNLDIQDLEGVDYLQDLTEPPYPFKDDEVDEILAEEVLEHISFRKVPAVLKELNRILKPNGKLYIQVPAIDKMCEMYTLGQVCDCVMHKPKNKDQARGKKDCPQCKGHGRVNPDRWHFAFTGAGKSPWDFHLSIFTLEELENLLRAGGFTILKSGYDEYGWKCKVTAKK